jgi:hypothetical protein
MSGGTKRLDGQNVQRTKRPAGQKVQRYNCAGSSGAVHSVFLINVYLDLESPGGSGFWVGENRRVTEGTERVSLQAPVSRGGRILTQKEGSK